MSQNATDVFDLDAFMDFDVIPSDIDQLTHGLEQAQAFDVANASKEELADFSAALKRLSDAAKAARKDVFEAELTDRTDEGEQVGDVKKVVRRNRSLKNQRSALTELHNAGVDLTSVCKINLTDFESAAESAGIDPDPHIDVNESEYMRRVQ